MPGPVKLKLDAQEFLLCPRDDKTELTSDETSAAVSALRQAITNITATQVLVGKAQTLLGPKEFGKVESGKFGDGAERAQRLFDILHAAFRVEPTADKTGHEDLRRCMSHVSRMLGVLKAGLTADNLVLADLEAGMYAKYGAQALGGYVDPPWYQKLQIQWASNFRQFWTEGEVKGPIHLNLTKLSKDGPTLARTLVHEATHKFARTKDVSYYNDTTAPGVMEKVDRFRNMPFSTDSTGDAETKRKRAVAKTIADVGTDLTGTKPDAMEPADALNNADSWAFFVFWMAASPTMLD
jgi:hypothetical protein